MSQLSSLLDFQKFQLKKWGKQLKKDPERAFIGAADPFSSKVWGKILGKDYEPMVTQLGGSTEKTEYQANDEGIDTKGHNNVDSLAKALTAFYTGRWLSNLGGSSGTSASPGSGYESVGGSQTYNVQGPTPGSGYESVGGAQTYQGSNTTPSSGFNWQDRLQSMNPRSNSQQSNGQDAYNEYLQRKKIRELARQLQEANKKYG